MASQLDIDVKNAKALGLSYGYYKAQQHAPVATPVKGDESCKTCPVCGKFVQPPMKRFCSKECRQAYQKEYHRQRYRARCGINVNGVSKEVD